MYMRVCGSCSCPGGTGMRDAGGLRRVPARAYAGAGASPRRHSLAGMNCQPRPRAGGDEPVMIFQFAIIDLGKRCGDWDESIRDFIGRINPRSYRKARVPLPGRPSITGRWRGPLPARERSAASSFPTPRAPGLQPRGGRAAPLPPRSPLLSPEFPTAPPAQKPDQTPGGTRDPRLDPPPYRDAALGQTPADVRYRTTAAAPN